MSVEKYDWAIQNSLSTLINQDSTFSHTRENSKMFNISSKYFSIFNNKPPASRVVYITKGYSYMLLLFVLKFHCGIPSWVTGIKRKRATNEILKWQYPSSFNVMLCFNET